SDRVGTGHTHLAVGQPGSRALVRTRHARFPADVRLLVLVTLHRPAGPEQHGVARADFHPVMAAGSLNVSRADRPAGFECLAALGGGYVDQHSSTDERGDGLRAVDVETAAPGSRVGIVAA